MSYIQQQRFTDSNQTVIGHKNEQGRRYSEQHSIAMAGSLFQHMLAHLKAKDDVTKQMQASPLQQSYITSSPVKASAFQRLLTPKRDSISDTLTQTSSRPTTPRLGAMLVKPVPVYASSAPALSVKSSEEAKDESPAFGNVNTFEQSQDQDCSVSQSNVAKITKKTIKKRKPATLDAYKDKCKAKHDADKRKLEAFNDKISNGTITQKEKQQRLNLIRQINSRNYRIQNKELIQKQQAFIDFTVKFAESNNIDAFLTEYRKFKESDEQLDGPESDEEFESN